MVARGPAELDWTSAPVAELTARLADRDWQLHAALASAIRNRVAQLVMAEPAQGLAIAQALLRSMQRQVRSVDAETRAIVWRAHAEACLLSGRTRMAHRSYEKASREAAAARKPELLGEILVGRVHVLSLIGEAAAATRLARRAQTLLERSGNVIYLGKLHMNRGNAHYQREDFPRAYESYRQAADLFAKAGLEDATWAGLLINQAIAASHLGRIAEARETFLRAEAACARLGLDAFGAHARYDRAFLEAARGDYRAALGLLEDAGEIFEREGILDMTASAQRARAEIYVDLGMGQEAIDLARAAAQTFTKEGMPLDAMIARVHESRALLLVERSAEAVTILQEAERYFREQKIRPRRAAALLEQARAILATGEADVAGRLARRAHGLFTRLGISRGRTEAQCVIAESLLARKRFASAERALAPVLAHAQHQAVALRVNLWELAGRIARGTGRPEQARRRFRRAAAELEALRQQIPGPELRARAFEDHVRIYHALAALELEANPPQFERIFQLSEAARARGFRDRMHAAPAAARSAITAGRAELGALVRQLEDVEFAESGAPDPRRLRRLQTDVRMLEREVADRLRRAEGRRAGARAWGGAPDPDRLARRLKRDEALIEYFISGDAVWALVLRRNRRDLIRLPAPVTALREQIRRVHFQLEVMALSPDGIPGDPAFVTRTTQDVLGNLHAALIAPLAAQLPDAGRIHLVPHRFLHAVPFECLWDGEGYIDARYTLSRCPTAEFLLRGKQKGPPRKGTVVVAGIVTDGPAAVAAEIEMVAARFPSRGTRLLRDPSSAELLDALPDCRLLHLSTHGVFRDDNPLFSRLRTGDGAIFLADILDRRLEADLVVLSACNTGQVFTGAGDDLSGVAHGFLAAGARQLVASLWRAHDEATRLLMERFYDHYRRGPARGDPAAALRAASREMRRDWPHPFYWGGFSTFGA